MEQIHSIEIAEQAVESIGMSRTRSCAPAKLNGLRRHSADPIMDELDSKLACRLKGPNSR